MNIILFGPPGSGKGTQSRFIVDNFNLKLISLGDILRKYSLENFYIKNILSSGVLISNNIILDIVRDFIKNNYSEYGYLLDGFPRNIIQAKSLNFLNIDCVIELRIDEKIIFQRLLGRRIHLKSGRVYHLLNNPPKNYGLDDITGEKIVRREDDSNYRIIKKRLSIYYYELIYLRCFYKKKFLNYKKKNYYYVIDANNDIKVISFKIINLIKNIL